MELNKKGTLGTDSLRYEYTKVVLCGDFGEKYEGFWSLIYVDSANHAISPNGDSYWANCRYTVQDKTVRLNLNPSYLPMAQKEWTLTYDGDCLETMYGNQLKRLHSIRRYMDKAFEFKAVSTKGEGCYEIAPALTDNYNDGYHEHGVRLDLDKSVKEGKWNFEWSYDNPATPWACEFCAREYPKSAEKGYHAVPVTWKLYAKLNEGDNWTLLDQQTDNTNWYGKDNAFGPYPTLFTVRQKKPWQYYRLEVTKKSQKNEVLTFSNFRLLY